MHGMVVAPQPRAADVGAAVLANGGNAFDAAVAAAFAQMIADPFMCGIGGMGTMQVYVAATGEHAMIDFHTRAGSKVTPEMWQDAFRGRAEISGYTLFDDYRSELGYTSIMTPGTVAGFFEAHQRYGTKPWAELLASAIAMAREGTEITPFVYEFWARQPRPGMPNGYTRLATTEACKRLYLKPNGALYAVGERIANPDYAATLEHIAQDGAATFYHGELGQQILTDLSANGSYVTPEDFANYSVCPGNPVTGTYRGYTVRSNPPPGSGVTLIEMLHILEHFELGTLRHGSAAHLDLVARAMAAAHADRNQYLGDPAFVEVPVDMLVSKAHAAAWAERIRNGYGYAGTAVSPPSCTTHLCVYDELGNAVSVTHTLGTGSGVITPGLGFVYNNAMKLFDPVPGRANSMAAGKARTTGMCPTMVYKDQKPVLIVGAPGGSVIISAVLQSILNIIDFGMSPVEAVTVPRIHCEGGTLHAEARVPAAVCNDLETQGHRVEQSPLSFDPVMSRAQVIQITDGTCRGGSDPRGGGGVAWA
jgi:gamma-glutamyltranspeptidase/glutathione hydrolase